MESSLYSDKGVRLAFDFTGTDSQSPSSMDFSLSIVMFEMLVGIYLLFVYDSSIVANNTFHDLLYFPTPEGTSSASKIIKCQHWRRA